MSFATRSWKLGTLKGLFRRAFLICSTEAALKKELRFLREIFTKINGYPCKIVNSTLHEIRSKWSNERTMQQRNATEQEPVSDNINSEETPYICLPFKGSEGEAIMKTLKNSLRNILPDIFKPRVIYKGTKLGSFFPVKDKIDVLHQTNLIYGYKPTCGTSLRDGYIGETSVRFQRRMQEHISIDKASSVYKFGQERNIPITFDNFNVLERGFNNRWDRKIAEALYIKEHGPVLNERTESYKLTLFN